jgi:hypothetical protein
MLEPGRSVPDSPQRKAVTSSVGAAHLKFLQYKRRTPSRNFKWKSDTRIISLLVLMTFRNS